MLRLARVRSTNSRRLQWGALAELGVVAVQAQGDVADREPRAALTIVEELEPSVLVVGAARDCRDVDLIEIVLARILDEGARLQFR